MGLVSEQPVDRPLILTSRLDTESEIFFNTQRTTYFPAALNHLNAHVTLFHNLPGVELQRIQDDLHRTIHSQAAFAMDVTGLRSLGRGVAYTLGSSALTRLREELAAEWSRWLLPQDRQKFNPHVTIQNKVEPEEARRTLALLEASFQERQVQVMGLDLWRYQGGPWSHVCTLPFLGVTERQR